MAEPNASPGPESELAQEIGASSGGDGGFLNFIERLGNRLPDPTTLFFLGTVLIVVLSWVAAQQGWSVTRRLPVPKTELRVDAEGREQRRVVEDAGGDPVLEWEVVERTVQRPRTETLTGPDGQPRVVALLGPDGQTLMETVGTGEDEVYRAKSLLTRDGAFWAIESAVRNFINFAPLGVVLVGMLGIGIAERVGLMAAALKAFMLVVPPALLTPAFVFLGIMSSMGIDAGYVVLPPLAAALYKAAGRSPLAGLAAVFAGVAAGFNANLFVTGLDPLLAGMTQIGATIVEEGRAVNPACNWYFMIASTFLITATGWFVTARFVERRLAGKPAEEGGPARPTAEEVASQRITPKEARGLVLAALVLVALVATFVYMTVTEGMPLHGRGTNFDRWAEAIVPMLFLSFLLPAIAFGIVQGEVKSDKHVAKFLIDSIAAMAPIVVLAFFAGQFIEYFKYTGLDKMLALAGGQALGQAQMPPWLLITAFILVTAVFNLFIGSMSAKYAMFAPIFVPMFMLVGISPELTQAAYRIGDSVSNSITPLNPYLVIVLVFMQRFVPRGGMGTLISTMLPYSIAFAIVWIVLILAWMALGVPLGVDGALWYELAT